MNQSLCEPPVAEELAQSFFGITPLDGASGLLQPDYRRAFIAWEAILGRAFVRFDEGTLADYERTTLPKGTRPAAVLRPESTREVQEVARIAQQFNVRLHAISRGKNWGYGDACAPTDGQVIVELTRMNRIREVNVELGYAVIEPGVSQGQMYEYLQDHQLPLMLDVTGAGPDASIVGNILQRGFGHTPYGDRFRHTSGFEVVLPDGTLFKTGFGQFESAKAAYVFPAGSGPWIDGLFTQSNLGIVTGACIWLMPKPEVIEGFALKITDESRLGEVLDALRKLRMRGTVRSTVHVANDLRVLSSRIRYPWERAREETPLPDELRRELRAEHGLGVWNVLGATYGAHVEVRAARKVIHEAFRRIAPVHFFRRKTLTRAQWMIDFCKWIAPARRLRGAVEAASSAFDLLEGIPSREHLGGAFWRRRSTDGEAAMEMRDSGLIWISPVLPLQAEAAVEVLGLVTSIFAAHKFDPLITMTAITERALCCVMSINYDKGDLADAENARDCAKRLHVALAKAGYFPYRRATVA